jgi:hypothetical protein
MRWFVGFAATAALVAAVGACGSQITVPDQGVVVVGCQKPNACFRSDCDCTRAAVTTPACVSPTTCSDMNDPSTCHCQPIDPGNEMAIITTQCLETAQACVGRGVFCGGGGARCLAKGSSCASSGGDPPMLIATSGPSLEPHCQFTDDVCCGGSDAGVSD